MQGLNWKVEVSLDNGDNGESLAGQTAYEFLPGQSLISMTRFSLLDPINDVGYVFKFNVFSQLDEYRFVVSSPPIFVSYINT